jgi:TonB family protein
MRGPGTSLRDPTRETRNPGLRNGLEAISTRDGQLPRRGETPAPRDASREPPGGEESKRGGGGTPSVPDLRPSEEMLARAVGGGSVDKLDGVESGEETALNSKQWKYASFFNRMKRQVAQNWHPDQVYLRRDPTGRVYGTKDRLTILQVSLTPEGKLARVFIAKQSGVDFLDDEAVRAFRESQPFPNPPTGLLDSDNMITFSFGFHFQIGDRNSWKVFRYQ